MTIPVFSKLTKKTGIKQCSKKEQRMKPMFKIGDKVKIDTRTGEYSQKVN